MVMLESTSIDKVSDLTAKILNDVAFTNEIITLMDMLVAETDELKLLVLLSSLKKVCLI